MLFRQADRIYLEVMNRQGNRKEEKEGKKETKKEVERKCSRRDKAGLFAPMSRYGRWLVGKVSFCTSFTKWKKASLAVETAFVLPLFFMGMLTIISFMDVYKLETEKLVGLCERTKDAGMYAYVLDGSGPKEVTLPDLYSYQPVGGWIRLPRMWLHNVVTVHAWTGKTESDMNGDSSGKSEQMVWMTETGSVYHVKPDCTYMQLSIEQVSGSSVSKMTNEYGEHYEACRTCSRSGKPAGSVYITGSGTSYHNLETCSGLKRTIRLVPESEVKGVYVCSRCG